MEFVEYLAASPRYQYPKIPGCRQESGDCQKNVRALSANYHDNMVTCSIYVDSFSSEEPTGNHIIIFIYPNIWGFHMFPLLWADPLKFRSELTLLFAASDFQLQPSLVASFFGGKISMVSLANDGKTKVD